MDTKELAHEYDLIQRREAKILEYKINNALCRYCECCNEPSSREFPEEIGKIAWCEELMAFIHPLLSPIHNGCEAPHM